jgi:hypothetical protein
MKNAAYPSAAAIEMAKAATKKPFWKFWA